MQRILSIWNGMLAVAANVFSACGSTDKLIKNYIMENSQIFLQEWEKKNNPFYPNEMKWDRVKINNMLAEYEAKKAVLPQADVIKSVCLHEWDEGHQNVSKCKRCGKYSA